MSQAIDADWKSTTAIAQANAKRFEQLYAERRHAFSPTDIGQHIVINIKSGDYVIAATFALAMQLARQKFGSTEWCWSRQIRAL